MSKISFVTRKQKIGFMKDADGNLEERYVSKPVVYNRLGLDEVCEHIVEDSQIDKGTVRAGVYAIVKQMKEMMMNGHIIQVGDLGYFRCSFKAQGEKDPKKVSVTQIIRRGVNFTPYKDLKTVLGDVSVDFPTVKSVSTNGGGNGNG